MQCNNCTVSSVSELQDSDLEILQERPCHTLLIIKHKETIYDNIIRMIL